MRKYLKPAMEMEAFDLRNVITASEPGDDDFTNIDDEPGQENSGSAAPVILEIN